MKPESAENAIIDLIIEHFSNLNIDVDVVALPETIAEYDKPFVKSKITVGYLSSKYQTPEAVSNIVQEELVLFSITVQSKFLRGDIGAYNLLEQAKIALLGKEPTSFQKLYAKEAKFIDFDEQIWEYLLIIEGKTMTVEKWLR